MSRLTLLILGAFVVGSCLAELSSARRSFSRSPNKNPSLKHIELERYQDKDVVKNLALSASQGHLGNSHPIPLMMSGIFYAIVRLGTPGQPFKLIVDTGAKELFVPSILCKSYGCRHHNKFENSKSSTYKEIGKPVKTYEGPGILGQDVLSIGDLDVGNQTFAQLLSTKDDYFSSSITDGYLGMQPVNSLFGEGKNLLQNLFDQKLIDELVVSFYLSKANSGNKMILGGVDSSLYKGDIHYVPLISNTEWRLKMDKIEVQDPADSTKILGQACESGCEAVAMTGSSVIMGPKDQVKMINDAIGVILDSNFFYKFKDCSKNALSKLPPVEIVIGSKVFKITSDKYVLKTPSPDLCISAIFPFDIDHWILGEPILRSYYSVFDLGNKRFGLAEAA